MKLMKKLEDIFSAAAFAEEGEFETARRIMKEGEPEGKVKTRNVLGGSKGVEGSEPSPARS